VGEERIPSHRFLYSEQGVELGAKESELGLVSGGIRGSVFLRMSQSDCSLVEEGTYRYFAISNGGCRLFRWIRCHE